MSSTPRFIHLRTHTEYSLLEGAVRLKKLPDLCAKLEMPAVALTDTNNMFAALEMSVTLSGAGIQPILGCQIDVAYVQSQPGERPRDPAPVVLLAQSERGYENLMKLNSCLYVDKGEQAPQVTLDELEALSEGLICLTGGPLGPVGMLLQTGHRAEAEALLKRLHACFGDRLYIELQRHPGEDGAPTEAERLTERGHVEMAYAMDIPLVATNDVYFPKSDMYEAHDALICIAEGAYVDQQDARRRLTAQHYFKSPQEMAVLFADLPEALENTIEIAKRCAFMAYKRAPILPKFADDEVAELRRMANEGLQARLAVIPHAVSVEEYQERLDFELGIIEGMGFPGYFLIVADFIQWSKDNNIPVGPGRGSGAGSLVAYALTITDLDPLRYSLLFERFLNPERVSMPDFDIDFCMDRREETIRYVQEKYGRDKVGQIITFGALLSKAAVRDIGRVLQMPYGQVDRLSKMIPVEGVKPVSIEKALKDEPRLKEEARNEEVVARLLDYGMQVEGLLRDVKIAHIYEGTNGIQALDLLGRKVARKGGVMFMSTIGWLNKFVAAHKDNERVSGLVKAVEKAKNTLATITMELGALGRKDVYYPTLNASPYLEMFGDVVMARVLVEQAALAAQKLEGDVTPGDKKFFEGKIKTAEFFVSQQLPRVDMLAATIRSGDKSALEMEF